MPGRRLIETQLPDSSPDTLTSRWRELPEDLLREASRQPIPACLEEEPARRPASALALSEQLTRFGRAGAWNAGLAQPWWEMHRVVT